MIKKIIHDGDIFDSFFFDGFDFDQVNDVEKVRRRDVDSGNKINSFDYRVSFVGFLFNDSDDVLVSLPKHYLSVIGNEEEECKQIYRTLIKYCQLNNYDFSKYLNDNNVSTNFPFDSFFNIYEYYEKYGLYYEQRSDLTTKQHGKIDWKSTIRLSKKYIVDDELVLYPFLRKNSVNIETFLTLCMAYSINYTIRKFHIFLEYPLVDFDLSSFDLMSNREAVVEELRRIKKTTYNDLKSSLIDNLINYFRRLSSKGRYHFKCYNFAAVWEEAARYYLSNHFDGVDSGMLKLSSNRTAEKTFVKPVFRPNIAKANEYFQPDCYYAEDGNQYILDAKYYLHVGGIMYKELSYVFMLKDIRDYVDGSPKYSSTVCALLLPSESRKTTKSFQMDPLFNKTYQDVTIYEEYLDIKKVLEEYIS